MNFDILKLDRITQQEKIFINTLNAELYKIDINEYRFIICDKFNDIIFDFINESVYISPTIFNIELFTSDILRVLCQKYTILDICCDYYIDCIWQSFNINCYNKNQISVLCDDYRLN